MNNKKIMKRGPTPIFLGSEYSSSQSLYTKGS